MLSLLTHVFRNPFDVHMNKKINDVNNIIMSQIKELRLSEQTIDKISLAVRNGRTGEMPVGNTPR